MAIHQLIFATNNAYKVSEIQLALGNSLEVISLKQAGILVEIPEPHATLEENAREKSTTIYQMTGKDCFSEDTGLEVDFLQGAPGVRSARFAGDDANASMNIALLLEKMKEADNRKARFRTVISLFLGGKEYQFEGICEGHITHQSKGEGGFGYDPVFVPEGGEKCFAEMTGAEKNRFSHRRKAADQLIQFLQNLAPKFA
jgi:XTP/dITP diphosphohydrolase